MKKWHIFFLFGLLSVSAPFANASGFSIFAGCYEYANPRACTGSATSQQGTVSMFFNPSTPKDITAVFAYNIAAGTFSLSDAYGDVSINGTIVSSSSYVSHGCYGGIDAGVCDLLSMQLDWTGGCFDRAGDGSCEPLLGGGTGFALVDLIQVESGTGKVYTGFVNLTPVPESPGILLLFVGIIPFWVFRRQLRLS